MPTITIPPVLKERFKKNKIHYEGSMQKEVTEPEFLSHVLSLYEYNNKIGEKKK